MSTERDRYRWTTCADVVRLVTDYIEGLLPPAERDRFEEHLLSCGPCREYLEQMRLTIAATGRLTEDDVPEPAIDELLAAFREWRRP